MAGKYWQFLFGILLQANKQKLCTEFFLPENFFHIASAVLFMGLRPNWVASTLPKERKKEIEFFSLFSVRNPFFAVRRSIKLES